MDPQPEETTPDAGRPRGVFEELGRRIDECPGVITAEAALRRAKAEFEKAQSNYQNARQQASENLDELREATFGEIVDRSVAYVRRHPARSLGLAALVGFFLGRLFRR